MQPKVMFIFRFSAHSSSLSDFGEIPHNAA